ncbi:MAG TPA: sulfatase-like hydrolase/transferase [Anaerolineae bacterium]|nr:sulfatase-like hydrolase/transferase [Anaerolineae bacterium]
MVRHRFVYALTILLLASILFRASETTASVVLALQSSTPSPQVYLPLIAKPPDLPNFIVIIADDQRYDTLDFMPLTKARIFERGVSFSSAYVTTPLCCPSRSSILTGLYAHNHQVYDNYAPLNRTTLVQHLHDAGYFTGIVGKYLNSWDGEARSEFDYWVVFAGHGAAQRYFDPNLNVNGTWTQHSGYITTVLGAYALNFMTVAAQRQQPFFFLFTPSAPHEPAYPAPGDENLYADVLLPNPPSFMEDDMSDKPLWLQGQAPPDSAFVQTLRRRQLQALHSLDNTIGRLLDVVEQTGQGDRTVVMYLSDNGVFLGEHRLAGKAYAYEEAIHVPFAIRYPARITAPRVESRLVANVDIAPTIYEIAGLSSPTTMDGRSLLPLLEQDTVVWRDSLLIEGWAAYPYMAVRTHQYLYIETDGDIEELYDSANDPYQLQNQYTNPAYASLVNELHTILSGYRSQITTAPPWRVIPSIMSVFGAED